MNENNDLNVPGKRFSIFISYAKEDEDNAKRLYNDLKNSTLPIDPMMDTKGLNQGESWTQGIYATIKKMDFFIPILSKISVERSHIQREFKLGLRAVRESPRDEIIVIPVRLDKCEMDFEEMKDYQYVDLFPDWYTGLSRILKSLKASIDKINSKEINASSNSFEFAIEEGDITNFTSDVIVLKYAQDFYGADLQVAKLLEKNGISRDSLKLSPKKYLYVETNGSTRSQFALFIGVQTASDFKYKDVREFGTYAIELVSKEMPQAKHIAMTIHGIGFGLDEAESFLAQFGGIQDCLLKHRTAHSIKRISIVDRNHDRVERLRKVLQKRLSTVTYGLELESDGSLYKIDIKDRISGMHYGDVTKVGDILIESGSIDLEGIESEKKPHVFVAMPFHKEFEDVFYLGIQEPVRDAGLLCERIDNEAFTGDVLEQVKKRIETAALVIAVLTGANPNVYLEIGYAWGKGRQTILLAKEEEQVKFDVQGQKYLKYETITALRKALSNELSQLKSRNLF